MEFCVRRPARILDVGFVVVSHKGGDGHEERCDRHDEGAGSQVYHVAGRRWKTATKADQKGMDERRD